MLLIPLTITLLVGQLEASAESVSKPTGDQKYFAYVVVSIRGTEAPLLNHRGYFLFCNQSNSFFVDQQLMTSFFISQARLAMATP